MSVSLIIPTRNQHDILDRALKSIADAERIHPSAEFAQSGRALDIIVVDNDSDHADSQAYLAELPATASSWGLSGVRVLPYHQPFNYAAINNIAAQQAHSDVLCFLNNDVEVLSADWLHTLHAEAMKPKRGCVGALLYFPNNTVQHAGVVMGMGTIAGHAYVGLQQTDVANHPYFQQSRASTAVTGACLAIKRSTFMEVGQFDTNLAVAFNDVDLCLKVQRAGYQNVFLPHVELLHHESLSRGKGIKSGAERQRHQYEIQRMKQRWGNAVEADPNWLVSSHSNSAKTSTSDYAYTVTQRRRLRKSITLSYLHKDLENS